MPTFPLPTLGATITPTGVTAPTFADIFQSIVTSVKAIFGSDIVVTPDSQDGQLLAIFALAQSDQNQTVIAAVNGFAPTFSQGAMFSALVKINGIARQIATHSTCTVTIVGVAGTIITNGIVQDTNRNLWNLPDTVIVPGGGSIDVTATAQNPGSTAAAIATLTTIFTPTLGWQTVTNAAIASPGAPVESDAALRRRQAISTGLPAQTPLQSIAAAVANVAGVHRSKVYENSTDVPDINGISEHSISVVEEGGDIIAVAQVIEQKKSPGTGTFGATTVVVFDPSGVPVPISFYVLTEVAVFVTVTIHPLVGFVSTTSTDIINSLVAFINGLDIGDSVFYNWLFGPASLSTLAEGLTFRVTAIASGTAASPTGTADLVIAFNQAATTVAANIVVVIS